MSLKCLFITKIITRNLTKLLTLSVVAFKYNNNKRMVPVLYDTDERINQSEH